MYAVLHNNDINIGSVLVNCPVNTLGIVEVGSYAYGINTEDSDHDYLGIFVIPLRRYLAYDGHGADSHVKVKPDVTYHDVGKFCRLASQGNPSVLEALWCPARYETQWFQRLTEIRKSFLHKGSLKPYFGYYTAQANRMKAGYSLHTTGGEWNPKFAAHLLRLMFAAKHLALQREVLVKLEGEALETVQMARAGAMTAEQVIELGEKLKADAQLAESQTGLPALPNRRLINECVFEIRMAFA